VCSLLETMWARRWRLPGMEGGKPALGFWEAAGGEKNSVITLFSCLKFNANQMI